MDSKLSLNEKKAYVSLYKKNGLAYALILMSILAELTHVIMVLDVMTVNYLMGITVMINILILFVLFTCAVKVNVYNMKWSMIAVGFGIYMIVRAFVLVPYVLKPFERQTAITIANLMGTIFLITAGVISVRRTARRQTLQEKLAR